MSRRDTVERLPAFAVLAALTLAAVPGALAQCDGDACKACCAAAGSFNAYIACGGTCTPVYGAQCPQCTTSCSASAGGGGDKAQLKGGGESGVDDALRQNTCNPQMLCADILEGAEGGAPRKPGPETASHPFQRACVETLVKGGSAKTETKPGATPVMKDEEIDRLGAEAARACASSGLDKEYCVSSLLLGMKQCYPAFDPSGGSCGKSVCSYLDALGVDAPRDPAPRDSARSKRAAAAEALRASFTPDEPTVAGVALVHPELDGAGLKKADAQFVRQLREAGSTDGAKALAAAKELLQSDAALSGIRTLGQEYREKVGQQLLAPGKAPPERVKAPASGSEAARNLRAVFGKAAAPALEASALARPDLTMGGAKKMAASFAALLERVEAASGTAALDLGRKLAADPVFAAAISNTGGELKTPGSGLDVLAAKVLDIPDSLVRAAARPAARDWGELEARLGELGLEPEALKSLVAAGRKKAGLTPAAVQQAAVLLLADRALDPKGAGSVEQALQGRVARFGGAPEDLKEALAERRPEAFAPALAARPELDAEALAQTHLACAVGGKSDLEGESCALLREALGRPAPKASPKSPLELRLEAAVQACFGQAAAACGEHTVDLAAGVATKSIPRGDGVTQESVLPGGTRRRSELDSRGRLTASREFDAEGKQVAETSVDYDWNGSSRRSTRRGDGTNSVEELDAYGRLLGSSSSDAEGRLLSRMSCRAAPPPRKAVAPAASGLAAEARALADEARRMAEELSAMPGNEPGCRQTQYEADGSYAVLELSPDYSLKSSARYGKDGAFLSRTTVAAAKDGGQLLSTRNADGGSVSERRDQDGRTKSYTVYGKDGKPVSESEHFYSPEGELTIRSSDLAQGTSSVEHRDKEGRPSVHSAFAKDGKRLSRTVFSHDADGGVTAVTKYAGGGSVVVRRDKDGRQLEYAEFGPDGRLIGADAAAYAPGGEKLSETATGPGGGKTEAAYGLHGPARYTELSAEGEAESTTEVEYDEQGRRKAETSSDLDGARLRTVFGPHGPAAFTESAPGGEVLARTQVEYDAAGRKQAETTSFAEGGKATIAFGPGGRKASETILSADGTKLLLGYGAHGPTELTQFAPDGKTLLTTRLAYGPGGQPASETSSYPGGAKTVLTYGEAGEPEGYEEFGPGGKRLWSARPADRAGEAAEIAYADGRKALVEYGPLGEASFTLADAKGRTLAETGFVYGPEGGREAAITKFPDGGKAITAYGPAGESALTRFGPRGEVLFAAEYAYGQNGKRTQERVSFPDGIVLEESLSPAGRTIGRRALKGGQELYRALLARQPDGSESAKLRYPGGASVVERRDAAGKLLERKAAGPEGKPLGKEALAELCATPDCRLARSREPSPGGEPLWEEPLAAVIPEHPARKARIVVPPAEPREPGEFVRPAYPERRSRILLPPSLAPRQARTRSGRGEFLPPGLPERSARGRLPPAAEEDRELLVEESAPHAGEGPARRESVRPGAPERRAGMIPPPEQETDADGAPAGPALPVGAESRLRVVVPPPVLELAGAPELPGPAGGYEPPHAQPPPSAEPLTAVPPAERPAAKSSEVDFAGALSQSPQGRPKSGEAPPPAGTPQEALRSLVQAYEEENLPDVLYLLDPRIVDQGRFGALADIIASDFAGLEDIRVPVSVVAEMPGSDPKRAALEADYGLRARLAGGPQTWVREKQRVRLSFLKGSDGNWRLAAQDWPKGVAPLFPASSVPGLIQLPPGSTLDGKVIAEPRIVRRGKLQPPGKKSP